MPFVEKFSKDRLDIMKIQLERLLSLKIDWVGILST